MNQKVIQEAARIIIRKNYKERVILVIDDDRMSLELFEEILNDAGYFNIITAQSVEAALDVLKNRAVDLVFTDLLIPYGLRNDGGNEVLEYMAENHSTCPVVVFSGSDNIKYISEAMHRRSWDFLQKPLQNNTQILATIESAFKRADEIQKRIEENKLVETALKASELRYQQLFNSMVDGCVIFEIVFDKEGQPVDFKFLSINPSFERFFGLKKEAIIGQTVLKSSLILPASLQDKYLQVAKTGQPVEFEQYIPELEKYFMIKVNQNALGEIAAFFSDITEAKNIQQLMIQTEKMNSLGQLAAGMAHEIKNPLASMIQLAQVIQRRLTNQIDQANVETAQKLRFDLNVLQEYLIQREIIPKLQSFRESGLRINDIIEKMLGFSRQNNYKMTFFDVEQAFDCAIELSKVNYDFRKVKIFKEEVNQLKIIGFQQEIEQVFLNLVNNAAYEMYNANIAEPQIIFRAKEQGNFVQIEVEDNGPGMSEQTKKRIFVPFFTTKPAGQGTGLGLYLTYIMITKDHNGSIYVESREGEGTRFIIKIPKT